MKINTIRNTANTFPQANDIYKIILFVDEMVSQYHKNTLDTITIDVVDRQLSYYKSAAEYLGLVFKNKSTDIAELIFNLDKRELFISMVYLVLRNDIFYNFFMERNQEIIINELIEGYNMSEATANRRFSTIKRWIEWCDIIITDYNIIIE